MSTPNGSALKFSVLCFRIVLWLMVLAIALAVVIPIAAVIFFDPNDYKPQIRSFVMDKTGLPLEIQGNIELKVFPWIGLKVEKLNLPQAATYGEGSFIYIDEMDLQIPLRELVEKHFHIETLNIKGLKIHLIKKSNGQTNWQDFTAQIKPQAPNPSPTQATANIPAPTRARPLTFALAHFEIKNAMIHYDDRASKQQYVFSDVQLRGEKNDNPDHYPLAGQFEFEQTSAAVKGHGEIRGEVVLDKDAPLANLHATLDAKTTQASLPFKEAKLTTLITANKTKLILDQINFKSPTVDFTGTCTIPFDTIKPITFKLNIPKLNANDFQSTNKPPVEKAVLTSKETPPNNTPAQPSAVQNMPRMITGDITIQQLQVKNMQLSQVNTTAKIENNILKLNPFAAVVYQGKLQAQISHPLLTSQAPTTFDGKISALQIQPLLHALDLKQKDYLSGTAALDFNLAQSTSQGLYGTVQAQIKNGVINGVDLKYYLNKAQAILKKEKATNTDTQRTPFDSLSATLKIHDNVIYNNDLQVTSSDFKANGEGSIDFNQQTISYKMQAWKQYTDESKQEKAYPLAIRISGSLARPKVEPDLDVYLKKLLKQELKKQLSKQLEGTEGTTPEDVVKDKVNKGIEQGLKKIFKLD